MKKQKQKKPDGRCATCPRWDRWHIRTPNSEGQKNSSIYTESRERKPKATTSEDGY